MGGGRIQGPMSEDLEPRTISGPPRYRSKTDKGVEYVALADRDDRVIGYFYANDEDDAAGWQGRADVPPVSANLAAAWIRSLRDAKKRGLKPSAALDELIRRRVDYADDPRTRIVGPRKAAPSLASLRKLAGY
jgi:hypothetical protein